MGELESTEQKHLCQIPQAQLVPQPAKHDLEHNVGRQLEEVERTTGSFVGLATAVATPKDGVAEIGGAVQVPDSRRLAMGADHGATVRDSRVTRQPASSRPGT